MIGWFVFVVPPPVSGLRRTAATETSVSLEWNVPVLQNQHHVLDYQIRYSPKVNIQTQSHEHTWGWADCDVTADVTIISTAARRVSGSTCPPGLLRRCWRDCSRRHSIRCRSGLARRPDTDHSALWATSTPNLMVRVWILLKLIHEYLLNFIHCLFLYCC